MSLVSNIAAVKSALAYVESRQIISETRRDSRRSARPKSAAAEVGAGICMTSLRFYTERKLQYGFRPWVQESLRRGCGDCTEHAGIAIVFIFDKFPKIRPLEMIAYSSRDHTTMVVGRVPGSDLSKPSTWGDDAVICDAHEREWYVARKHRPEEFKLVHTVNESLPERYKFDG